DLVQKVFVFPQETKTSHVLVQAQPGQPLQNLTLCLRSYTDLTRPHSLFSYATKAQANEVLLFKPKPSAYQFHIGGKSVTFTIPPGRAGSEHVCASWESATGIVRFWLDGRAWPRKGLQKGYRVGAEASIVLGQEQDSFGGGFDAQQSFVGEISSVYMWDLELSSSGVKAAMEDTPYETPIFGWRNFPYQAVGEVYLKP
ncbi:CRP protein, partial [Indicator maculatus]|nr:CRP protein [Indicator maculatus]